MIRIIFIALIAALAGAFIYSSYFHYYEGRNNKQNEAAKRIYDVTNHVLSNTEVAVNSLVITRNRSIADEGSNNELYKIICESLLSYGIDLEKQVYYIEIRDGRAYKVIYSSWEFSGYAGCFPEYNLTCYPYHLLVNKAYGEFVDNRKADK